MKENEPGEDDFVLWTVYERPRDYPNSYVARCWVSKPNAVAVPTSSHVIGATLQEVRDLLPPGLTMLPRMEGDDPCIVETWL